MSISLNSTMMSFNSMKLQAKYQDASWHSSGVSLSKATKFTPWLIMPGSRMHSKGKRFGHYCLSVADNDKLSAEISSKDSSGYAENSPTDDQSASANLLAENLLLQANVNAESGSQTSEVPDVPIDQNQGSAAPVSSQSTPKRLPLTARERVRAARVLNRYTESKTSSKPEMGSRVLDALRESDRGKKRSRLPEAPTNLFDDSKRGMPKAGLTFQFPGGFDLFLVVFSFVFISTVMFATTYFVWKVGAIHFNEY